MKCNLYKEYLKFLTKEKVPEFINKYLELDSLKRLKNICYFCGMDYASKDVYNFRENISRFDHSLTVALLTWSFTKNKKATLAGLFHDVGTPCFAHVIDYMNKDYEHQESTEEFTEEIISKDKTLEMYLKEDGIAKEEVINFKNYSIVDNNRPKLCADRLDGIILTGIAWTKKINSNDIADIISALEVFTNEFNEKELGFKSELVAKRVLEISNEIDIYCHSNEDNYMMELLADITRKAIESNIIKYEDLYYIDEPTLFKKLKKSNNESINNLLHIFENVKLSEIPKTKLGNVKIRDLNPIVNGKRLSEI